MECGDGLNVTPTNFVQCGALPSEDGETTPIRAKRGTSGPGCATAGDPTRQQPPVGEIPQTHLTGPLSGRGEQGPIGTEGEGGDLIVMARFAARPPQRTDDLAAA